MYFNNVYFIIGTAYAGKSTMVKLLADKYHGVLCEENYHDRFFPDPDPEEFPCLSYTRTLEDWHDFIRRTPEEYKAWIDGVAKECETLELRILPELAAQGKPVFVDTNISIETLKTITDPDHVLVMLADPMISVRRFFERPDREKQFLYQLIMEEPDPEKAMENYRQGLMLINSQENYNHFLNSGFHVILRDEERSIDETLELAEKAFGLHIRILNFGSLNLDYTYAVDHFVNPGETLSASAQSLSPGGKGLNQSVALAKAGAEVYHAGCIGKGGEMLQKTLEQAGVNTDYLREVPELQGNAVIQVIPSGENCILLFGGSNRCITEDQITETLQHFQKGDCLLLQNEVNLLPEIIEKAYEKGLGIFLNPSPCDEKIRKADLSKIRWLLVNEVEMEQLTGENDPGKAWEFLHGKYPALSLLVTLGSEGSIAFTDMEIVRQTAFPVKAVDTTGAGDTFTGYFITSLTEGLPLSQCLRHASMASAIAVTRPGAAVSIPEKEEVLEMLEKA